VKCIYCAWKIRPLTSIVLLCDDGDFYLAGVFRCRGADTGRCLLKAFWCAGVYRGMVTDEEGSGIVGGDGRNTSTFYERKSGVSHVLFRCR
jgi:hypothetical protein